MSNPFICFIHIEKAAGTSFQYILRKNFPFYVSLSPRYYWTNDPKADFTALHLKRLLQVLPICQGIGGHTTRFDPDYMLKKKDVFYITFLREPISRYLSYYNYITGVLGRPLSFDDYLGDDRFTNFMTKRLGNPKSEEELYSIADSIDFIGFQEKFNESLLVLKKIIHWKNIDIGYQKRNVNTKKNKDIKWCNLSPDQKEAVKNNNLQDIKLYNYSYQKFLKNIALVDNNNVPVNNQTPNDLIMQWKLKGLKFITRYILEPFIYRSTWKLKNNMLL